MFLFIQKEVDIKNKLIEKPGRTWYAQGHAGKYKAGIQLFYPRFKSSNRKKIISSKHNIISFPSIRILSETIISDYSYMSLPRGST